MEHMGYIDHIKYALLTLLIFVVLVTDLKHWIFLALIYFTMIGGPFVIIWAFSPVLSCVAMVVTLAFYWYNRK